MRRERWLWFCGWMACAAAALAQAPAKRTSPDRRGQRPLPAAATNAEPQAARTNAATGAQTPAKPAFTRKQVEQRLRMLRELRDRGLILQPFYERKVRECEAGLSE